MDKGQGVDRVTDYHQEAEVDKEKASSLIKNLQTNSQKQRYIIFIILILILIIIISTIKIAAEDVALIADECEITNIAAEHLLRNNDGDVKNALASFVKGETYYK